jgi:hypothetical protein
MLSFWAIAIQKYLFTEYHYPGIPGIQCMPATWLSVCSVWGPRQRRNVLLEGGQPFGSGRGHQIKQANSIKKRQLNKLNS